jgi:hypothetical protein
MPLTRCPRGAGCCLCCCEQGGARLCAACLRHRRRELGVSRRAASAVLRPCALDWRLVCEGGVLSHTHPRTRTHTLTSHLSLRLSCPPPSLPQTCLSPCPLRPPKARTAQKGRPHVPALTSLCSSLVVAPHPCARSSLVVAPHPCAHSTDAPPPPASLPPLPHQSARWSSVHPPPPSAHTRHPSRTPREPPCGNPWLCGAVPNGPGQSRSHEQQHVVHLHRCRGNRRQQRWFVCAPPPPWVR